MTTETYVTYPAMQRGIAPPGAVPARITETIQQIPTGPPQPYQYQHSNPGPYNQVYRVGSPPGIPGGPQYVPPSVRETVTTGPFVPPNVRETVTTGPFGPPPQPSYHLATGLSYQPLARPTAFQPLDRIHENGHPDVERYTTEELKAYHEYLTKSAEEGRSFRGSGERGEISAEDLENKIEQMVKDCAAEEGMPIDPHLDTYMLFCELSNRRNDLHDTLTEPFKDCFPKLLAAILPIITRCREIYLYDQISNPKHYIATNLFLDAGQRATETDQELCRRIGRDVVPHLLDIVQDSFFDVEYLNRDDEELKWMARRELIKKVFTMLYNCVRNYPDNRKVFRKHNAWNILKPFLDCRYFILRAKALFILAYIVTEEENIQLNTTVLNVEFIVKILRRSLEDPSHYSAHYNFYAVEVVEAIKRIAVNDGNKDSFIGADVLPHLINLMGVKNSMEERESALNALWVLSFSSQHKHTMLNAEGCITNIDACIKIEAFTRTCQAIKWNLHGMDAKPAEMAQDEDGKEEAPDKEADDGEGGNKVPSEKAPIKKPPTKKTPHVMISYQWDVQKQIKRVKEILAALGFNVWLDIEQMGGSTLEAMAKAVEDSCVVIICFSEKYKDSPACRTEAEYTWKLRKPFVPLKMQTGYNPDGWLGALLGNALYIEMNTLSKVQEEMPLLVRQLDNRGRTLPEEEEKDDDDDDAYVSSRVVRIVQSRAASPSSSYGPQRTPPVLHPRPMRSPTMVVMPPQPAGRTLPPSGRWSPRTMSPTPGRFTRIGTPPVREVVEVPVYIEKVVAVPSSAPQISKSGATCVQLVQQWDTNGVVSWLSQNNYSHLQNWFVGYNGEDILELKKVATQAPEFFFTTLRQEFGFKSMLEIIRFKKMLENII